MFYEPVENVFHLVESVNVVLFVVKAFALALP